jgi:hypothetical protein
VNTNNFKDVEAYYIWPYMTVELMGGEWYLSVFVKSLGFRMVLVKKNISVNSMRRNNLVK